ncbi:uncharacterized protein LODBEIA_P54180 [Lodderomyces beijingensis]|uniref:Serine hydrolase domain-containing protein n=1 Tax=Lodderomyces beijingensis TaxID=1775926 RepID=A0ABP0ZTH3_9ASCO
MTQAPPKRILFFHGYTQNAALFRAKTSALRKKLQKFGFNCIYLNAPYVLSPADLPTTDSLSKFGSATSGEESPVTYRGWWIKPNKSNDCIDLDLSIAAVRDYVQSGEIIADDEKEEKSESKSKGKSQEGSEDGDVVGLIGFSQGASFAGLIAEKFNELFGARGHHVKFVVCYSGFKLDTSPRSGNEKYQGYYRGGGDGRLRYLHVYGELDTVVDETRSLTLYQAKQSVSDVLKHPGGHFVPNSKLYVDQVCGWVSNVMNGEEPEKSEKQGNDNDNKKSKDDDIDELLAMMDGFGKA